MFSPRGRTPVLWALITRRDWPSTSPSKAQLLPGSPQPRPVPPLLAQTSGLSLRVTRCHLQGHLGTSSPVLCRSGIHSHPFFPVDFFLSRHRWGLCLVKGGVRCRSLQPRGVPRSWSGLSGLPAAFRSSACCCRDSCECRVGRLPASDTGRNVSGSARSLALDQGRGAGVSTWFLCLICGAVFLVFASFFDDTISV